MAITTAKIEFRKLAELVYTENVRLSINERFDDILADNLLSSTDENKPIGLREPILIDASNNIIEGRRRYRALVHASQTQPELFQSVFSKGIPVVTFKGNKSQALLQELNHAEKRGLAHKAELIASVVKMILFGFAEKSILTHLFNSFCAFYRPSPEKLGAYYKALEQGKLAESEQLIVKMFHGTYQSIAYYAILPSFIFEAWKAVLSGTVDSLVPPAWWLNWDVKRIPDFGNRELIKTLAKAFESDLLEKDSLGIPVFNRDIPGPKFLGELNQAIAKLGSVQAETRAKAMSANDIEQNAQKLSSRGLKVMSQVHAGKVSLHDASETLQLTDSYLTAIEYLTNDKTLVKDISNAGDMTVLELVLNHSKTVRDSILQAQAAQVESRQV